MSKNLHRYVHILTGNIGSGKSSFARMLSELGADIVSADALAREVVKPGSPAYQPLTDYFGKKVLDQDGMLDRKQLGSLIFNDAEARAKLESITHPAIRALAAERFAALHKQHPSGVIVYECPLFFEARMSSDEFGKIILIIADAERRKKRILSRDALSSAEIEQRMGVQISQAEKKQKADIVIENNSGLAELQTQAARVYQALSNLPTR